MWPSNWSRGPCCARPREGVAGAAEPVAAAAVRALKLPAAVVRLACHQRVALRTLLWLPVVTLFMVMASVMCSLRRELRMAP